MLFPSPGDLPDPRIEPGSPALQADSLPTELPGNPFLTRLHWGQGVARDGRKAMASFSRVPVCIRTVVTRNVLLCPARKGDPQQPTIQLDG